MTDGRVRCLRNEACCLHGACFLRTEAPTSWPNQASLGSSNASPPLVWLAQACRSAVMPRSNARGGSAGRPAPSQGQRQQQVQSAFWEAAEDCVVCGGVDFAQGYGPRTLVRRAAAAASARRCLLLPRPSLTASAPLPCTDLLAPCAAASATKPSAHIAPTLSPTVLHRPSPAAGHLRVLPGPGRAHRVLAGSHGGAAQRGAPGGAGIRVVLLRGGLGRRG